MEKLMTISGREFKIKANKAKRHYTIIVDGTTYRTSEMTKEEFEDAEFYTGDDWQHYLNTESYKVIKK